MKILLIILAITLGIIILFLLYLLVSPLKVIIDSRKGYFSLGWNNWLKAKLVPDMENLGVEIQIPFWRKKYMIEEMMFSKRSLKVKKKESIKNREKKSRLNWSRIRKVLAQIKIKELNLICDTDDFILNAYATPIMEFLNTKKGYNTHMNFMGKNEIKIEAESRIYNMLKVGMF